MAISIAKSLFITFSGSPYAIGNEINECPCVCASTACTITHNFTELLSYTKCFFEDFIATECTIINHFLD